MEYVIFVVAVLIGSILLYRRRRPNTPGPGMRDIGDGDRGGWVGGNVGGGGGGGSSPGGNVGGGGFGSSG